jgi:hypothetical protein
MAIENKLQYDITKNWLKEFLDAKDELMSKHSLTPLEKAQLDVYESQITELEHDIMVWEAKNVEHDPDGPNYGNDE